MSQEKSYKGYPILEKGQKVKIDGYVWEADQNVCAGWNEIFLVRTEEDGQKYTRSMCSADDFELVE